MHISIQWDQRLDRTGQRTLDSEQVGDLAIWCMVAVQLVASYSASEL